MLVAEVDGAIHARQRSADARRDRCLVRLGYRVLRIPASLVMKDIPSAVALVRTALEDRRR
jgi:very-short-patch-repair endonuclease